MTRQDKSQATVKWTQGLLASEEDLLAKILELDLQALMEAERSSGRGWDDRFYP